MVNMEVRVDDHADIRGMELTLLEGFDQAVGLVRHAGVDNDVMAGVRE
jgi:hypothetical protein